MANEGTPDVVDVVVGIEPVAVGQINFSAIEFGDSLFGIATSNVFEIRAQRDFMVAGEKTDFDTFAGEFFKGCQNWYIGAKNDPLEIVPKIEEIS